MRQSLPVAELAALLSPDRIEPGRRVEAMARLEAQLRLREVDARHYSEWERRVLSIGAPDALAELDEVRTGFIDVIGSAPETAGWSIEFSGNLPALRPEASTPHAREVAELDTALINPQPSSADVDSDAELSGRVGETGWREHDAVFGAGVGARPRVTAVARATANIARFFARARSGMTTRAR